MRELPLRSLSHALTSLNAERAKLAPQRSSLPRPLRSLSLPLLSFRAADETHNTPKREDASSSPPSDIAHNTVMPQRYSIVQAREPN